MHFLILCYQVNYDIISESDSMLPEYGICMSLVRSTSAALCICDICSVTFSDYCRSGSEDTDVHDKGTLSGDQQCQTPSRKRLTINDVVDILCYVWYLPLFFAGPLMTWENFRGQVCSLLPFNIYYNFLSGYQKKARKSRQWN